MPGRGPDTREHESCAGDGRDPGGASRDGDLEEARQPTYIFADLNLARGHDPDPALGASAVERVVQLIERLCNRSRLDVRLGQMSRRELYGSTFYGTLGRGGFGLSIELRGRRDGRLRAGRSFNV